MMSSDKIGLMSQACINYILKSCPYISSSQVEVCPNTISCSDPITIEQRQLYRKEFNLPMDKTVFVYGGNISDVQGKHFMELVIEKVGQISDAYLVFLGNGEAFDILKAKFNQMNNVVFREPMIPNEYHRLTAACDVGLVFLNSILTVPNIPSRILFYMDNSLPVLCAIDCVSDLGKIVQERKFGYSVVASEDNLGKYMAYFERLTNDSELRETLGKNARDYLEHNWSAEKGYEIIMSSYEQKGKK